MPFYFDPTYFLVLIGVVLSLLASARLNSTYARYLRERSLSGMTGAEAARRILSMSGISDVRVEHIAGNLTDHYDLRTKGLKSFIGKKRERTENTP